MMRTSTLALAGLAATLALVPGGDARAQLGTSSSTAACNLVSTSLVQEALRGKDLAGDERFFSTEGAPPNIHFLLDNSGSMQDLAQPITKDGCTNFDALQLARGWDIKKDYPPVDDGTGLGADTGFPRLFQQDKFYAYLYWEDSTSPDPQWTRAEDACAASWSATRNPTQYAACLGCLQTKGYYVRPNAASYTQVVFSGKFLNFNPPKYVTARKVMKEVIKDLKRVRAGYSTFNGETGARLGRVQNPGCKLIAKDASAFDSNRAAYVSDINAIRFDAWTPLAESLFNIGQYFSSSDAVYTKKYKFPSKYLNAGYGSNISSETRGWCWGCQNTSIIIITDGQPTRDANLPVAELQAANGGAVTCPDWDGNGAPDCGDGPDEKLDDVAAFLGQHDLQDNTPVTVGDMNTAGTQSVTIYGVGFAEKVPILRNAAERGGGYYLEAEDADTLKASILDIIASVQTRATSFSSAAVSSFQVNRTSDSVLGRFTPSKDRSPWVGSLYGFDVGYERVLGCRKEVAATMLTGGAGDPADLNHDGDCDDFHLIDKNGRAVVEDDTGAFKRMDDPTKDATPQWEAGAELEKLATSATPAWKARRIWTVVDGNGDGKLDRNDAPVEFSEANAAVLREYLGIPDSPTACDALRVQLGLASLSAVDCAKVVINYVRGADALAADPANRGRDRASLLGAVYHSAPLQVTPPFHPSACGVTNQCLKTLFAPGLTPLVSYAAASGPSKDAYLKFLDKHGLRDRVALVATTDGLLHAFDNGTLVDDPVLKLKRWDAGTGKELWAFVPPDVLPRLRPNLGREAQLLDGSPQVREVWLDGVGGDDAVADNRKQAPEFRTVVLVGTGEQGVHRFALDITDTLARPARDGQPRYAGRPPNTKGDFLWLWPQPNDRLAAEIAEGYTQFSPRAPPIGAVAMADDQGPFLAGGVKAREQWVVFLNGGYDKALARGRGVAMVDVATGSTLWSFFYGDGGRADNLRYPVAGGVAMVDQRLMAPQCDDIDRGIDCLFDTAVFADWGGQVWTVSFATPGKLENGKVTNWYAARSFQVEAATASALRPSFSYMPALARPVRATSRALYAYLGTGDRNNLTDVSGSTCRLSNPYGCAWQGCDVSTTVKVERGGGNVFTGGASYQNAAFSSASRTAGAGGNACSSVKATYGWDIGKRNGCNTATSGKTEWTCDTSGGVFNCRATQDDWTVRNDEKTPAPAQVRRIYGFNVYGGLRGTYDADGNGAGGADTFEQGLLTDSDLVDITPKPSQRTGKQGVLAKPEDFGWYYTYEPTERTGSSTEIAEGLVTFNSFLPSGVSSAICSTVGTNTARLYSLNVLTGKAGDGVDHRQFGADTARAYIERNVIAAPSSPTRLYTIAQGKGSMAVVLMEAGRAGATTLTSNEDLAQAVSHIELDATAHNCRHAGQGCK